MTFYTKMAILCNVNNIKVTELERKAGLPVRYLAKMTTQLPGSKEIAAIARTLQISKKEVMRGVQTTNRFILPVDEFEMAINEIKQYDIRAQRAIIRYSKMSGEEKEKVWAAMDALFDFYE